MSLSPSQRPFFFLCCVLDVIARPRFVQLGLLIICGCCVKCDGLRNYDRSQLGRGSIRFCERIAASEMTERAIPKTCSLISICLIISRSHPAQSSLNTALLCVSQNSPFRHFRVMKASGLSSCCSIYIWPLLLPPPSAETCRLSITPSILALYLCLIKFPFKHQQDAVE